MCCWKSRYESGTYWIAFYISVFTSYISKEEIPAQINAADIGESSPGFDLQRKFRADLAWWWQLGSGWIKKYSDGLENNIKR